MMRNTLIAGGCCLLFAVFQDSVLASGTCNSNALNMARNHYPNLRLRSRVVESQAVSNPIECYVNCMSDCRCVSYNVCNGGRLCELNSEKKEPSSPLIGKSDDCDYHEFIFNRQVR